MLAGSAKKTGPPPIIAVAIRGAIIVVAATAFVDPVVIVSVKRGRSWLVPNSHRLSFLQLVENHRA